ncbi:GAP family protein [Streptomyces chryseus]
MTHLAREGPALDAWPLNTVPRPPRSDRGAEGRALQCSSRAIGATLSAALAVALSPFPLIGVVLILSGGHGRRNGSLFALGWVVGLSAVATLIVIVFDGADDPDSTSSAIAGWGRVAAGAGLIVLGVRKWWLRPGPVTRSRNRAGWPS